LKNENEVRERDFEENLVLDRSFLLPLNRSEAPIVLVLELVLVLGFSWVGAKISKIENPSAALAIPTWPHRECKPQEQRISTTSAYGVETLG
jgi:hypothetical protein